ncbi:MAG: TonB-dependent receptor [Sediminibacterium sp.]|nr:TonB-dependent receptor [Sediminibacterium sp.]
MKKSSYFFLLFGLLYGTASNAQTGIIKDTVEANGDSVVVTATRTERKLSNLTVPVTIINAKTIQQNGALRLTDILKEQTGLNLTSGFGAGVQLQGLNPDYTIILINGEPLVGRTAGVLDLNRIALGNIKKIEIVKGPSSSLYGSEAMAGVINIITDASYGAPIAVGLRYGTYNTLDANLETKWNTKNVLYQGFYNVYSTDGYSIRPNSNSRVTTPIDRYSTTQQLKLNISTKTNLVFNTRFTQEQIQNEIAVSNNGVTIYSIGKESIKDANLSASLNHRFSTTLKTSIRGYTTTYDAVQNLVTINGLPYRDVLNHNFKRLENQTDWDIQKKLQAVFGIGAVWEGVKSSRYDSEQIRKQNEIQYAFTQWEWKPTEKFTFIGGLRFDNNTQFASALSPKVSMLYKLNPQHQFKLSIGQGFKAPDFRQLFLDFTNAAAGSYSVFGVAQAQQVIAKLDALGQIGNLFPSYYQLKALKPEYSNGVHFTWDWKINTRSNVSVQFFRNDIKNLIESQQVGTYISGAQIYSYLNIGRAFTTGFELEGQHQLNKTLTLSGGYQYLVTGDKDQIAEIKSGTVYTKNSQGYSRLLKLNEYVGLPNTSKHKLQIKLNYNSPKGYYLNVRTIYRSRWAVNNNNGNEVFDNGDVFASGYVAINSAAGKTFKNGLNIQAGIDNITNYIDAANLPNLPGRTLYMSVKYQIQNRTKKF